MSKPEDPRYLYSPWRMDYILGEKAEDCVMCRYQQLGNDEENLILYRAKHCYVMMNRYPYNNGHLMIVPYIHKSCLSDLDSETWLEMCETIRTTERILMASYHCDGINIGLNLGCAAGAGIAEHLHVHLVPRWLGDSNFMTVVCGERVIPEYFETAYARLKQEFAKLPNNKE
ncbi:MAG: HIT domain-containing protein [Candidatus Cloacimonetes bacterium]|jgi:ATP adenylyltransferase|nr:HIT domain-containing protein [Candidatus Cloacimonadota bacterium]MDD3235672.1 HIT domain-containing protein [Candidatus Cloacimonadota bacterium]